MERTVRTSSEILLSTALQSAFWLVLYCFGYLRWDIRWLVFLVGISYVALTWQAQRTKKPLLYPIEKFLASKLGSVKGKGLNPREMPAWLVHPDTQRTEWTNVIFKQLWPHLDKFLKATLRSVESDPQLQERLRGYHVKSLSFPTVSLGSIPPKLAGVKVHKSVHRDEIILDVSIAYSGNLEIEAKAELAGVPASVPTVWASIRNMTFTGLLRYDLDKQSFFTFPGQVCFCDGTFALAALRQKPLPLDNA